MCKGDVRVLFALYINRVISRSSVGRLCFVWECACLHLNTASITLWLYAQHYIGRARCPVLHSIKLIIWYMFAVLRGVYPKTSAILGRVQIRPKHCCVPSRGPFVDPFWLTGAQFVKEPLGASRLTLYNKNRLLSLHIYPKALKQRPPVPSIHSRAKAYNWVFGLCAF